MKVVCISFAKHLPSVPNQRYGPKAKMRATRDARKCVRQGLAESAERLLELGMPIMVRFIDRSRREKDYVNMVGAFKAPQDAVAELLGVDDGPKSTIMWEFDSQPARWRTVIDGRTGKPKKKRYDSFEIEFVYE